MSAPRFQHALVGEMPWSSCVQGNMGTACVGVRVKTPASRGLRVGPALPKLSDRNITRVSRNLGQWLSHGKKSAISGHFLLTVLCLGRKRTDGTRVSLVFNLVPPAERCDIFDHLQGSFGPFGPKSKKVSEGFPGPLGTRGPKSQKRVENRVENLQNKLENQFIFVIPE